jgi:hypothetical protein
VLRVSFLAVPFDIAANVALFVPLGFLYRLARPPGDRLPLAAAGRVLVLGLALSAAVECAQLFEAERYASPVDVLTNGIGALLGAWLHAALSSRLRTGARLVGRLALELPLVSLVYLLVPLCWLGALTVGTGASGVALLAALGLFGATVLGAVQGAYLGPEGVLSPRAAGLAAGGWFLVGTLPALAARPALVAPLTAAVAAAGWLMSDARGARGDAWRADRRFELTALQLAAPFYAAFLLLLRRWRRGRDDRPRPAHEARHPAPRGAAHRVRGARLHGGRGAGPRRAAVPRRRAAAWRCGAARGLAAAPRCTRRRARRRRRCSRSRSACAPARTAGAVPPSSARTSSGWCSKRALRPACAAVVNATRCRRRRRLADLSHRTFARADTDTRH